ncbi:MAG: beta-ketoacyl synthase N-terminal-like domain-containing protein [Polyangiales bacterium]
MSAAICAWAAMVGGVDGALDPGARAWLAGAQVARAELSPRERWPEAPPRVRRLDRAALHALLVARRVVAATSAWPGDEVGVVLGTALGCAEVNSRYHRGLVEGGYDAASPMLFAQTIPSTPVGEVSIAFGLRGHSATVMAGGCSGVAAVAEAVRAIDSGRVRAALVLAGDTFGEDEVALRLARGLAPPGEATVALVLCDPRDADARAPRVSASLAHDEGAPYRGEIDWLGATGLLELLAWLDGEGARFERTVRCASGRRGELRASRGRGS